MRLSTLGSLRLDGSSFARPKPLLLLAYLALEGPQEKRHLAELFWPEAKSATRSLNVALTQLRGGAPGAVDADERHLATPLDTDARAFLERVEAGDLHAAEACYGGAFLSGVQVPWGVELEEWLLRTREFLAGHAREVALRLAEGEAAEGRFGDAARRAESAYLLSGAAPPEPGDLSRIHALLLAGNGARAGVVRQEAEAFDLELATSPQQARDRLRGEPTAARLASAGLPATASSFVGREEEAESVVEALAGECRLLSLLGPPGVGKTRLALHCAARLERAGTFDRVQVVPLDAARDEPQMLGAIAAALRSGGGAVEGDVEPLAHAIGDGRLLLVLDNLEQLVEAAPRLGELLERCPRLRILATSRERLALAEERPHRVQGLPTPARGAAPEQAHRYPGVELFVQRARRARADFELDARNLPAVLDIGRLVDGLPLGLEIAAAWLRMLPAEAIATELARGLDLLESDLRDVPERHRSLRNAIAWSWQLLGPREREVLTHLAVFRGGFTREAAEKVAGASIPLLASLTDKSLVRVEGGDRYGLHPLVAQFAREALARGPQRERVGQAHAEHVLEVAAEAAPHLTGPEPGRWLRRLEGEHDNLAAALDHLATSDTGKALRLAADLWRYWIMRGHNREGRDRLEALVALPRAREHPALRASLLRSLGTITFQVGEFARAAPVLREALTLAREHASEREVGSVLNTLAWVDLHLGEADASAAHCRESLELHERLGLARGVALAHNNLGFRALQLGSLAESRAHLERSLRAFESLPDERGVAHLRVNLALVEGRLGRREEARDLLEGAVQALTELGDAQLLVWGLYQRAHLTLDEGRAGDAASDLERALPLARDVGNRELLGALLALRADLLLERGRVDGAAAPLEEAQRTWRVAGYAWMWARTQWVAARLEAARHRAAAARREARAGLEHVFAIGDRLGVAEGVEELACLAGAHDPEAAARLLAQAEGLRATLGAPRPPRFEARHRAALHAARRALGERRFARAWRSGGAAGVEDARVEVAALT